MPGDKRYVRRNAKGQFTREVDLHKSLSQDDRHNSSVTTKPGQGDREGRAHWQLSAGQEEKVKPAAVRGTDRSYRSNKGHAPVRP